MTSMAQAASSALLHFIWQGLAIGVLLGFALLLLRRSSPAARYAASCGAMVVLALAPVVTGWLLYSPAAASGLEFTVGSRPEVESVSSASPPIASASRKNLEGWVLPLWGAGVFMLSLRLAWASGHASSLRRRGAGAESSILDMVAELAERTGIRRGVRVLISAIAEVPSVVGWIRPVLLLPASVVVGLTPYQLEAVIAHELAHIRRHDYLVNILQTIVETVLFYHPVVWWASSRMRYERELCCDDFAVRACGDPVFYARALARLERLRSAAPSLAMGSTNGPLLHRVRRLIGHGAAEQGPSRLACAAALIVAVLSVGLQQIGVAGAPEEIREPGGGIVVPQGEPLPVLPVPPLQVQPPVMIASAVIPPPPPQHVAPVLLAQGIPAPPSPPDPPSAPVQAPEGVRWVLFQGNRVLVQGSPADEAAARAAHQSVGGNLLWFVLDGKTYVTQDPASLDLILTTHESWEIERQSDIAGEIMRRTQEQYRVGAQLDQNSAEVRMLADRLRRLADIPVASQQDLNDVSRRISELQALVSRMRATLAEREARQTNYRMLEQMLARLGLRQPAADILRDAVSSGKARPLP